MNEIINSDYWVKKTSKETVQMVEKIFSKLGEITKEYRLHYTRYYIGVANVMNNDAHTFIAFLPRQHYIVMECKMKKNNDMDELLQKFCKNYKSYYGTNGKYKLRLVEDDLSSNLEAIKTFAKNARKGYDES